MEGVDRTEIPLAVKLVLERVQDFHRDKNGHWLIRFDGAINFGKAPHMRTDVHLFLRHTRYLKNNAAHQITTIVNEVFQGATVKTGVSEQKLLLEDDREDVSGNSRVIFLDPEALDRANLELLEKISKFKDFAQAKKAQKKN